MNIKFGFQGLGAASLLAGLLFFASCEKDSKPPRERPAPSPTDGSAGPVSGRVVASDDQPQGLVAWIEDAAAWEAAKPGAGTEELAGFKLLYFRTPRELGCTLLEKFSFTDPALLAYLKAHASARWMPLASPAADTPARRYGVKDTPDLVVLDREGGFAGTILGYRPPGKLLAELKALAVRGETQRRRAEAFAARLAQVPALEGAARFDALDGAAELAMERRLFAAAAEYSRELVALADAGEARPRASALGRQGHALAELGKIEEADRCFEQALAAVGLKLYGEDLAFRRAQARTYAGDFAGAAALWEQFNRKYPASPRAEHAAYNRAYVLTQAGRREEAARTVGELLDKTKNTEARQALRTLLYALAGSGAALESLHADQARRTFLADSLEEGRSLVRKYACQDCHLVIEPQVRSQQTSCVECHLLIRRMEKEPARHDEYLKSHPHFYRNCTRIRHILRAPNLFGLGARVRPEWIRKYLENPYDVRPHLEESMVQMNLERNEIETLVRYFQAIATVAGQAPPAEGEAREGQGAAAEKGRALFTQKKCFACHQFGNVDFGAGQGEWAWEEGRAEAPNLRFARERLPRRKAAEWIRSPERMSPGTRMPKFELEDQEVEALVDYLFTGDLGTPATDKKRPALKPAPAKPPAWEEVNAAIFQDTCVHCHMSDGEGGAGNVGAYGFRARRLDLSSYAGIRRGSLQSDGTRQELLQPREGGLPPLLLARLNKRVEENRRDLLEPFRDSLRELYVPRAGRVAPGMPLGHPALTPEQFALLEAWLAAGAPGPRPMPLGEPVRSPDEQPREMKE